MGKGRMSQPKRLVDLFGKGLKQDVRVNRTPRRRWEEFRKLQVGSDGQSEEVILMGQRKSKNIERTRYAKLGRCTNCMTIFGT